MRSLPGVSIRPCQEGDGVGVVALFNRVFGPEFGERSLDDWRWRFLSNPVGNRSAVAVADDGAIVAHIGGVPLRAWWNGRERDVLHAVDHMVEPERRRSLQRLGLFARLKRAWIEMYCAHDRAFFGFGFPSHADFRIGARVAGYSLIRTLNVLLLHPVDRLDRPGRVEVATSDGPGFDYDALWRRCRDELSFAVVRDRRYVDWRFAHHPSVSYRLLEARGRGDGALRGYAVVRAGGLAEDVATIVDWLVPREDADATRALLSECAAFTIERGLGGLAVWFAESQPEFDRFQEHGFRVRFTPILMAGRCWDRSVSIEWIRGNLYNTLADTDMF